MGCGASRPSGAVVTPAMTPAHAPSAPIPFPKSSPPLEPSPSSEHSPTPTLDPSPPKPLEESKTADPPLSSPILADTIPEDGSLPLPHTRSSESGSHPIRHHHHHRKPSTSNGARGSIIASDTGSQRGSLAVAPGSSPGHQRTLSGHHRSRSYSIVGGADGKRGSAMGLLDAGADPKDQMMANQVRRGMIAGTITSDGEGSSPVQRSDSLSVDDGGKKHRKRSSVSHEPHVKAVVERAEAKEGEGDEGEEGEGGHGHKKDKKDKKKKEKIIKTLELSDLQHLSAENLETLWKNYDKDKNGTLDRKEMKKLAKDCIGRTIAMCEEEIRRQQPKLTENELKAAVEKELKFVLPGAAKENGKKEDVQKEMVRRLVKKLDVNGDGDVTKAELLATWNVFAKELFQIKVAEGPVNCSIM